jgi:tRNA threonylcarbamoyladenosine biosynthesis protein TsaE
VNALKITVSEIGELMGAAGQIIKVAGGRKIFLIDGEMGAGKTTLIKEICKQLGSADNFSSPTFSIVNEYLIPNPSGKIYHIDLYRVKNLEEAINLGIEDYLTGDNYCFIEWPELVNGLLPDKIVRVDIKNEENIREIVIFMN